MTVHFGETITDDHDRQFYFDLRVVRGRLVGEMSVNIRDDGVAGEVGDIALVEQKIVGIPLGRGAVFGGGPHNE